MSPTFKYANLNNAIALGCELIVGQDKKEGLVRSILVPVGKGAKIRELVSTEEYKDTGGSALFKFLMEAQWFPIAVAHSFTDSIDAIEKRLQCLPQGFFFVDEDEADYPSVRLWKSSLENVCQKFESAEIPQEGLDENFLKQLFYKIPKDIVSLVNAGGFN